uniref:uncharacterized protein LOC124053075 n=1 Tax=Scatophagus argus TaxID=75038 RepID=UPI001ED838A0|nr:uncharacterized protein LOC124053075 [Scatophagus argus]
MYRWVNSLKKHAVTTQLIQIGNVRSFLKFLIEAELPQVKVPKKHLHGTLFSLQSLAKIARQELQTHRQAVRLKKSSILVNPANITAFINKANKGIPLALSTLEREKSREALEHVYGLLSGFIACITGHRKGVITNLKVEEFAQAEEDELGRRIIRVKDHKTKESFGHALIPLMKIEYMWFYRLMYNRHKYPCGKSDLVFSNSNGGPFNDILTSFQDCWESFGLPGRSTFSLIRSSISTCVGRSVEESKRGNIRRLMCHSTATAEKFYEADLGFSEAFQTHSQCTCKHLQKQMQDLQEHRENRPC